MPLEYSTDLYRLNRLRNDLAFRVRRKVFDIAVRVDASGPGAPPVLERAHPPQPTASELVALMPGIEIAERGDNYVNFDLRPYYAEHRL